MENGEPPQTQDERQLRFDESYMRAALIEASRAEAAGEVPVGAVLAREGEILASGYNSPVGSCDPTAHAEMIVLRAGARRISNYRLTGTTLYVTMEPCTMCAGALVHARVSRLVFACRDLRFGGVRSKFRLADSELLNHQVEIVEGVLAAEATEMIQRFFAGRR